MLKPLFVLLSLVFMANCMSASAGYQHLTVKEVDLDRFMGKWYVIASIPTWFERHASNAVETYTQKENGTIHVSFTYRHKTPAGKQGNDTKSLCGGQKNQCTLESPTIMAFFV